MPATRHATAKAQKPSTLCRHAESENATVRRRARVAAIVGSCAISCSTSAGVNFEASAETMVAGLFAVLPCVQGQLEHSSAAASTK
eukprot:scaffold102713_cov32-Tisochrysis_lutea.AAC.1